ncbi:MAG TPA: ATP-binding protein [Burkholderiaceae bacterium]|nr:ATP-binding protein [Burkholderiaceae bacterium]
MDGQARQVAAMGALADSVPEASEPATLAALQRENEALRHRAIELERNVEARTAQLQAKIVELDGKNRELVERRSVFNAALESAGLWVVTLDPHGRIVRCNRRCAELAGQPVENVIGETFAAALVQPDQRKQCEDWLAQLAESQSEPPDWEQRLIRDGDEPRIVTWFGRRLADADGRTLFLIAAGRDVTEQRRIEEEVRKRRAEVAHLHRVYTAGEMAAALAHELNQPLAAIAAYAEAAIERLERGTDAQREFLDDFERIGAQAHRAGRTIADLRRFLSKGSASRAAPCDLNELVRVACELVSADVRLRRISIELDLAPDLPPVMAEAVHVEHAMMNLIVNALDAMREVVEAGTVRISSRALSDSMARVSVRDNGKGVALGEQERVFEAFHTSRATGLGMGLTISRSIIEAHGGRLWAEPSSRGGIFHFTLPFAHASPSLPRR